MLRARATAVRPSAAARREISSFQPAREQHAAAPEYACRYAQRYDAGRRRCATSIVLMGYANATRSFEARSPEESEASASGHARPFRRRPQSARDTSMPFFHLSAAVVRHVPRKVARLLAQAVLIMRAEKTRYGRRLQVRDTMTRHAQELIRARRQRRHAIRRNTTSFPPPARRCASGELMERGRKGIRCQQQHAQGGGAPRSPRRRR